MHDTSAPHPSRAQLLAFDKGRLPPAEREAVERHVDECPECCRCLDGLPEEPLAAMVRAFAGRDSSADTPVASGGVYFPPDLPAELAGHPRYRILEVLGSGGMGLVCKAVHLLLDRVVALKVIHRRLTARPAFVECFRREARALARLSHPHIAAAHDAEQVGDTHFLVMEYVPGTSLDREVQRRGRLPVAEACDLVRQAALGLQHAHENGLVHRDVKPANLLVTPDGVVKVVDLGLARMAREEAGETPTGPPGAVVGTPDYLAPEQARDAHRADVRADVYSLGCTLYHLLAGHPPFPDGSPLQKLLAHQQREAPPIREVRADVPAGLEAILKRMLAPDPAGRYPTAGAVADALAPLCGLPSPPPVAAAGKDRGRRLRRGWLLAAVFAVVLGAAGLTALFAFHAFSPRKQAVEEPGPAAGAAHPAGEKPLAAVLTLRQGPLTMKDLRAEVVAWLKANNRFGPEHALVADTVSDIDGWMDRGDGFFIHLGPRLLNSRQATLLAAHPGGFFAVPLSDDLARELQIKGGLRMIQRMLKSNDRHRDRPRAFLSALAIDNAGCLDAGRKVTGSVDCHIMDKSEGEYALRLTFFYDKGRRSGMFFPKGIDGTGRRLLSFALPPLAGDTVRPQGPLLVFVELGTVQDRQFTVESNAVAALVYVTGTKPSQPEK
jgi:hypothetical protein